MSLQTIALSSFPVSPAGYISAVGLPCTESPGAYLGIYLWASPLDTLPKVVDKWGITYSAVYLYADGTTTTFTANKTFYWDETDVAAVYGMGFVSYVVNYSDPNPNPFTFDPNRINGGYVSDPQSAQRWLTIVPPANFLPRLVLNAPGSIGYITTSFAIAPFGHLTGGSSGSPTTAYVPYPSYYRRYSGTFNGPFPAAVLGAPVPGCMNPAAINYNPAATVDNGSCILPVPGCTNPAAINYNPSATVDNGTCILPVPGCMNRGATNYNPAATVDNGSCVFPVAPGCTNPAAINYNPSATSDNGSCILPVRGCTLAGSLNYNPAANVNDGSCIPIVLGCTVPGTLNYNALANKDDGSCVFGLAPAPAAPLASCCVWGGDLLLASAWAGDLLSACVWGPDLLLVSAWTSTDYCPAPVPVAAPATTPAYYGIANDPYSLGNDPLGGAKVTPDTSTPIVPAGPLAYYSIGNEPLLIIP